MSNCTRASESYLRRISKRYFSSLLQSLNDIILKLCRCPFVPKKRNKMIHSAMADFGRFGGLSETGVYLE